MILKLKIQGGLSVEVDSTIFTFLACPNSGFPFQCTAVLDSRIHISSVDCGRFLPSPLLLLILFVVCLCVYVEEYLFSFERSIGKT